VSKSVSSGNLHRCAGLSLWILSLWVRPYWPKHYPGSWVWNAVCTTEWQDDFLPWRTEHLGPVQLSSEPRSDAELSKLCSISLFKILCS